MYLSVQERKKESDDKIRIKYTSRNNKIKNGGLAMLSVRKARGTYIKNKRKNICDIATMAPMKNPTAIEL